MAGIPSIYRIDSSAGTPSIYRTTDEAPFADKLIDSVVSIDAVTDVDTLQEPS